MGDFVEVAVLAACRVRSGRREVLITRRGPADHLPNAWELPGGKVESCESPGEAAIRELHEETGVEMTGAHSITRLTTVEHAYPDRTVRIHAFAAEIHLDEERPKPERRRWVDAAELRTIDFPPANARITAALLHYLERHERHERHE